MPQAYVLRNGFGVRGAPLFLASYDATIAFAGLKTTDKIASDSPAEADTGDGAELAAHESPATPSPRFVRRAPVPQQGMPMVDGERELTTGLLSKDASFRLIVSGSIGVREIERLIRKLELDKEILADESDDTVACNSRSGRRTPGSGSRSPIDPITSYAGTLAGRCGGD